MFDWLSWLSWLPGFTLPSFGFGTMGVIGLVALAAIMALGGAGVIGVVTRVANGGLSMVQWLWEKVFAPGIEHTLKSGPAILATLIMGAFIYTTAEIRNTVQEKKLESAVSYLQNELRGYKATLSKARQEAAQCKAEISRLTRKANKFFSQ